MRGRVNIIPPQVNFKTLVNRNAIKPEKGVPSPNNFHNPFIGTLPQKFGKNLIMDPLDLLVT